MSIKIGSKTVLKVYRGSTPVSVVYKGSTTVYDGSDHSIHIKILYNGYEVSYGESSYHVWFATDDDNMAFTFNITSQNLNKVKVKFYHIPDNLVEEFISENEYSINNDYQSPSLANIATVDGSLIVVRIYTLDNIFIEQVNVTCYATN